MTTLTLRIVLISWALSTLTSVVCRADLPGNGADSGKTVVYRNTWGVPHIYAPTAEAGMYAIGWAQAEDRPEEFAEKLPPCVGRKCLL